MGHIVDSAIVRIMRSGRPVGAGCLMHGRLVLTCAHVVRDALGLPRTAVERPKEAVPIEFPKFPDIKDFFAHAIIWFPWADAIADDGLADIAVLDVGQGLDDPIPAHLLKSEDERLGDVIVYGFPEDAPLGARHGHWIEGHAELPVIGPAWFPIHHRPPESQSFIRPGYSGGPVVVDDDGPHAGRVAGIVVLRNRAKEPKKQAAYAISAEVLRKALELAKRELDKESLSQSETGGSPHASSPASVALGEDLAGTLDELRNICADLQHQHNMPADLIKSVDRLARASRRAVRADGQPDLQRLADYNEDWADMAAVVDREEATDLFESSPVRKLIDQIDQLTNRVRPSKESIEPTLHIPWADPVHPATQAARALEAECDDVMDQLWPEGADVAQAKRDAWHDVEEVHRTVTRRDGYDSRRMDGCRSSLERHKINLLLRTRALIGMLQGKFVDRLKPGTVFRDHEHGPEMVVIPAGSFMMGSPEGEEGRYDDENPRHRVILTRSFALGRYPLTFDEFDHFCHETGRDLPSDEDWGRDRRPVIHVSHEDAMAYVAWLSKMTEASYRLPSEAEWEYACRAGTTTPFWIGETISTDQANYNGGSAYGQGKEGEFREKTTPVGSFKANPFGLHDMHGNVWEWCADPWHKDYEGAPTDGSAWLEGGDASRAVVRGGSWYYDPEGCRSAYRNSRDRDGRVYFSGFRAARTLG